MKFSHTCDSCNRMIKLDYDESDASPAFCPFCGEELNEAGEFDSEPLRDDDMYEDYDGNDGY